MPHLNGRNVKEFIHTLSAIFVLMALILSDLYRRTYGFVLFFLKRKAPAIAICSQDSDRQLFLTLFLVLLVVTYINLDNTLHPHSCY
jgi:hypothetical protein